jgi:glutamate N-acetyltransferase/amino-acid N-acetyltransferase
MSKVADMKLEVPGFVAGAIAAGIKEKDRKDLALVFSETPACAAGVFTTNAVQAAPVVLDKERIVSGSAQAILANSGNANACTGVKGMEDARIMARHAAKALGIDEGEVLVASTGVIGQPLNMAPIENALPELAEQLSPAGLSDVVRAIMTTDTFPKAISKRVQHEEKAFTIAAVAKGAGMIRPDMATMLCFVCTDMGATRQLLQKALTNAVANSFNAITVDGDMSTNDTVLVLANGLSDLHLDDANCAKAFQRTLNEVLLNLALQIVEDGEGATKRVCIEVKGARNADDAKKVAFTVAESPLVKTAFFGQDANWGRIMAAAGRTGVPLNPEAIDIFFDHVQMVKDGQGYDQRAEAMATEVLRKSHFTITIDLKLGTASAIVHTCDLSTDYVKINADYRT